MTQHWMMRKLKMISGLSREISFVAITWNLESTCACRGKNHFLFRWDISTLPEKNVDHYWNVDGDRELSDTWNGFTRFTILKDKPPDGFSWSKERLTRSLTSYGQKCGNMSDASKRKEKQKWAIEKPKTRQCQKITWYLLH